MEALITFLLFAGFFYFMMRFGCGAHAVHGHGGGHGGHSGHGASEHGSASDVEAATDPVCRMTVAAGEGYTITHQGREVRLCSRSCLDRFEADPMRFAEGLGGPAEG